jgi:hypothetical protein
MIREPLAIPIALEDLAHRALDAKYMVEVFRRELPRRSAAPIRVTGCRPKAVKSRSALRENKLRIIYTLKLETSDGRRLRPRLLGTMPSMNREDDPQLTALSNAAQGHPMLGPFVQPIIYLPDLRMSLQMIPLDRRLPALLEMTGPGNAEVLEPFLSECRNGATIEQIDAEVLHYKPRNRCVIRLTARLSGLPGGRGERVVYAKIFADDRGAASHRAMQQLWDVARRSKWLRAPEPLGYDAGRRMLVMAEAPGDRDVTVWLRAVEKGQPLPDGVDQSRLERSLQVAAAALAELHGSGIQPDEVRTFAGEIESQRDDLKLVGSRQPRIAAELEGLLDRLQSAAPRDERLVSSHGGFRPNQLIGNDENLTIIDFDGLCMASPSLDAANFICRLRDARITQPDAPAELEQLADLFRAEFVRHEPHVRNDELTCYEALVLSETALRLFRRPGRGNELAERVAMLIAESHRLLDSVGRKGAP